MFKKLKQLFEFLFFPTPLRDLDKKRRQRLMENLGKSPHERMRDSLNKYDEAMKKIQRERQQKIEIYSDPKMDPSEVSFSSLQEAYDVALKRALHGVACQTRFDAYFAPVVRGVIALEELVRPTPSTVEKMKCEKLRLVNTGCKNDDFLVLALSAVLLEHTDRDGNYVPSSSSSSSHGDVGDDDHHSSGSCSGGPDSGGGGD